MDSGFENDLLEQEEERLDMEDVEDVEDMMEDADTASTIRRDAEIKFNLAFAKQGVWP